MKKFKVGIIGLGQRGSSMTQHTADVEGVEVTAICDLYQDRIDKIASYFKNSKG